MHSNSELSTVLKNARSAVKTASSIKQEVRGRVARQLLRNLELGKTNVDSTQLLQKIHEAGKTVRDRRAVVKIYEGALNLSPESIQALETALSLLKSKDELCIEHAV